MMSVNARLELDDPHPGLELLAQLHVPVKEHDVDGGREVKAATRGEKCKADFYRRLSSGVSARPGIRRPGMRWARTVVVE